MTGRATRGARAAFLVEGPQAVREAVVGGLVEELFCTPTAAERHPELLAGYPGPVRWVSAAAIAGLSETVTPQGIVAVVSSRDSTLAAALSGPPGLVVLLAGINDPGNAGTLLRTTDATGAAAVIFGADSVDPYNGKVVRASAGSLFHLELVRGADTHIALRTARSAGLRILAATGSGDSDLDTETDSGRLAAPTMWVFGNEARGLPADLAASCDARVRIPMYGRAESLNLAAAAAICLYASARAQRTGVRSRGADELQATKEGSPL